ncbi:hypothetical protein FQN54_002384 [Arachnomyces sp. PD_36]|nr:hypothetical protein FQN54_002384 [Arachnomyces sp. PD_36]
MGDKFVISQHRVIIHFAAGGSFLVWDYKTQVTMETTFPYYPAAIVFHHSTNSFSAVHTETNTCRVDGDMVISQFSVLGTSIHQTGSSVIIPGNGLEEFEILDAKSPVPDLLVMVQWSEPTENEPSCPGTREILVDFASSADEPSIHISSAVVKDAFSKGSFYFTQSITAIPETLIYQIRKEYMHPNLQVASEIFLYNLQPPESCLTEIGAIKREASSGETKSAGTGGRERDSRIFGNHEFLCLVKDKERSVTAFCFDEDVLMAGELPRYREIRTRRAAERAQLRKKRAEEDS